MQAIPAAIKPHQIIIFIREKTDDWGQVGRCAFFNKFDTLKLKRVDQKKREL